MRERFARAGFPARLMALAGELRAAYDTRPVSRKEWDAASGDDALARTRDAPLLFIGDDFGTTDVALALPAGQA